MPTFTQDHYEIAPDFVVDLRSTTPSNPPEVSKHRHVVILLPNGTEMWLDIGIENADHDFVDIRQFNTAGQMKGQGAFTIVNGSRQSFGDGPALKDTEGKPVTGHGWNGGYVVTLLVDKDGDEQSVAYPSAGNG